MTATRAGIRKLIPVLLVGGAAAGVGLVARLRPNVTADPPAEVPPVNVKVEVVRTLPELADTVDLTAVVEPNQVVRVAAEVAGQIERFGRRQQAMTWNHVSLPAGVPVEEGQPVALGQPLIHLNRDLFEARYQRALAQFEYDDHEYQRLVDLYARGITSKTEFDDATTRRAVSKANLDEVTRQLERTTIAAPLGGILNRLPREVGEYVQAADDVAEIVDIDTVKVVADVPERDIAFMQVGQSAQVVARGAEERKVAGAITYISALADGGTRTTRLEITVANRDHGLRSGQIVRARLTRRVLADVILIPLEAVIPLENGKMVYVVNDGRAQPRDVELDFIRGRSVRVLRGLAVGDRLIVAGHRYVGPGQPVHLSDEP